MSTPRVSTCRHITTICTTTTLTQGKGFLHPKTWYNKDTPPPKDIDAAVRFATIDLLSEAPKKEEDEEEDEEDDDEEEDVALREDADDDGDDDDEEEDEEEEATTGRKKTSGAVQHQPGHRRRFEVRGL